MAECHIEFSVEDGTGIWRWECFTCGIESQPFESLAGWASSPARRTARPREAANEHHDHDDCAMRRPAGGRLPRSSSG